MQRFSDFTHLLEEQAKNLPDHPSLFYEDNGICACITYARLLELCREEAAGLKSTGKTCLGVLCDGSLQCILTVFGSVLAGLQTVLLDENAPEELLQEQICTTDVDVLWMSEELKEELSLTVGKGLTGDFACAQTRKGRMLFFTSGTTESSKAVVLTDQSLMSSAWNGGSMLPLSKEDRLMCMLPLNHVFGFVCSLLWGLSCGASVSLGR